MATGDVILFEEALDYIHTWSDSDDIRVAILNDTTSPTASFATPALGDFTEVGTAGSYVAGGVSIGTWGSLRSEAAGVLTLDSATNPAWTVDPLNDTDAYWGLVFNQTQAGDPAYAYVDLGGPKDMGAAPLTITWAATGIARYIIS